MKHRILASQHWGSGRTGEIIWDDEAGTLAGDHYQLFGEYGLKNHFEEVKETGGPYHVGSEVDYYYLQDIRHNPADFLTLLGFALGRLEPPNCILPDSLKGIERTRAAGFVTCPPGCIQ